MNQKVDQNTNITALYSDIDEIIHNTEALINKFQRLTRKVLWIPLALLGFIRKNLKSDAYANFCRLDEQLGKASDVIKDFYTTNNVHLPLSTQTYIAAYGEYLQSVKAAAELRVTFEREILDYNIWTCTHNDLDNLNSLMDRISHSLDICEKHAQKVNEVIVSFQEQEERE